jgi:hypothetical protein
MCREIPCQAADSQRAREQFANPTRAFTTGPLWVWNDLK